MFVPEFQVLFSRPLPWLSCQMNVYVTMLTCQWLMGPCQARLVLLLLTPPTMPPHQA